MHTVGLPQIEPFLQVISGNIKHKNLFSIDLKTEKVNEIENLYIYDSEHIARYPYQRSRF